MILKYLLKQFANPSQKESWAGKLRAKRFLIFKQLLNYDINKNYSILDVGGTKIYWERMNFIKPNVHITLLNLSYKVETHNNNIESDIGDATDMSNYNDNSFDIIHSNSVIEHVGNFSNQKNMANEIKRVSKSYFIQTPNYYFPIEPHSLFIGFQFLPIKLKAFLIRHFSLGWIGKIDDYQKSRERVESIRLLTKKELTILFPEGKIYKEKFFGLTKSFIVYYGINDSH